MSFTSGFHLSDFTFIYRMKIIAASAFAALFLFQALLPSLGGAIRAKTISSDSILGNVDDPVPVEQNLPDHRKQLVFH